MPEIKKLNPAVQATFMSSLIAGGIAGTSVDVSLYPLDTLKTRLQSAEGFFKSGGFRGIYNGLSVVTIGSAPGAALFFASYEMSKKHLASSEGSESPAVHLVAASIGEASACIVRVPTEIIKQRLQTGVNNTFTQAIQSVHQARGVSGFYTGYFSMLAREIPFAAIQFPLWEGLKCRWAEHQHVSTVSPVQGAICGSIAGSFAAGLTTPLDVVKTRLMLGKDSQGKVYKTASDTFKRIYHEEGPRKLFAGVGPRTAWIGIGGFVFFGVYEQASVLIRS